MRVNKIVVVGGGSAGWMTASTLIKHFPDKDITLVESPSTPTVGVGESTIGQINEWLRSLDIKDADWMKQCDASYKLSIKFTDFYKKGSGGFHYPFGMPYDDRSIFPGGVNDWYIKKILYPDTPSSNFAETFFPAVTLSEKNKIIDNNNGELPGWFFDRDVAYHFDAAKFGAWLRDGYAVPRGVKIIRDDVVNVEVSEQGIRSLTMKETDSITADLFIDCTGWKSLLLAQSLNVEFESYADFLPNNSAWATRVPYTDKESELQPYTNCTAIDNGWVWNIPLWSRVGTGYVYSDKYVSDEDALAQFKRYLISERDCPKDKDLIESLDFKNIKMRVGIHKKIYHKNVCAIGLSAGFIEPLESNGLYTVHEFLSKLVLTLARGEISEFDRLAFNEACRGDFRAFAEFVGLHYALSHRDDTEYWRACKNRNWPKNMSTGIYASYGFDDMIRRRYVTSWYDSDMGGTLCIASGMNYFPVDYQTLIKGLFRYNKESYIDEIKEKYIPIWNALIVERNRIAEAAPSLYEYLKTNYGYDD